MSVRCDVNIPKSVKVSCQTSKNVFSFKIGLGIVNDTTNPSLRMIFAQKINVNNNFCFEKPRGWSARRARAFCAVTVI